jgi:hypothetical protein
MRSNAVSTLFLAFLFVPTGAQATIESPVSDQPMNINGVNIVCTGGDSDARANPNWRAYPMHLEFVGKSGQYLGDETVTITGNGKNISVHCGGPWLLMQLPNGTYKLSADVAGAGHQEMKIYTPGRVIMRFPNAGGSEAPNQQVSQNRKPRV